MGARRAVLPWLVAALAFGGRGAAAAEEPAHGPDASPGDELLEFLGSIDAEGEDWIDFLARTDVARAGKARGTTAPPKDEKR